MYKVQDKFIKQAANIFGRNEKQFDQDVDTIKKWIREQPHLPEIMDTRSIQNFLLLTKISIENTKQRIDFYYTAKSKLDDIYKEINPRLPHMKEYREIAYFVLHPELLNNNRVYIFQMRNIDLADNIQPINTLRHLINLLEIRLRKDVMVGDVFILDCTNIPLGYYFKLTPMFFYKGIILIYEKIFSMRLKGFYITNLLPFGHQILNIVKKYMKDKVFQRIHVLSDNQKLLEHFTADFLPPEFGGKGTSLEKMAEILEEELEQHRDLFDHLDKIRVDENLRPEALKNDELLGYYGNFKQIDVD